MSDPAALSPRAVVPGLVPVVSFALIGQPPRDLGLLDEAEWLRDTEPLTWWDGQPDGSLAPIRTDCRREGLALRFLARSWTAPVLAAFFRAPVAATPTADGGERLSLTPAGQPVRSGLASLRLTRGGGPDLTWETPASLIAEAAAITLATRTSWVGLPFRLVFHPPYGLLTLEH